MEPVKTTEGGQELFSTIADAESDPHLNGKYFQNNPTWHVEFSPWKADNIHRLLKEKQINPRTICEVGCGAGEVLRLLQLKMDPECRFWGYDVAPPAIETPHSDLLLVLEVVDHVEHYFGP